MQKYYRFKHESECVRKQSSSGGAFTFLSDAFIQNGGVVYGCVWNGVTFVKHERAEKKEERDLMRGSKYIQSNICNVYGKVIEDLCTGKQVMFSGTPCQVSALKKILVIKGIDSANLLTIEVLCHGVGSAKFFADYISHLEKKYSSSAQSVNFRAKHHKGQKQDMEVCFKNGKKYNASSTRYDWFYSVYHSNLILRPSCYECLFATENRGADFSIADHWGYKEDDAYSLIISSSLKADNYLQQLNVNGLEVILNINEIKQPHLKMPSKRPERRDDFWEIYLKEGYLSVQKWMGNNTLMGKIKNMLARTVFLLGIQKIAKRILKRIR